MSNANAVEKVRLEYDEVPYTSHPFPQTAPERLAAIAHLFGLDAPEVSTARVLELGCSSGGNLIPLAVRYPLVRAVGLDLSGVQISQGQQLAADLGLSNLELRQADLAAIDTVSLGQFDYIICHGVYSWVPEHVQDAILRICKHNLAPTGIAYVSYNTYPGWKAKEIVRDAMMLRGNPRNTPGERLSFARGMIDFLQQVARKDSVLAKTLEESAPLLRNSQDYYLLHEYLETFNAPCYFQQLLDRAGVHGLAYLAEAEPSAMFISNYGNEIAEPLLKECGHSQVLLEQYLDFVVNRTFRQTLLVHGEQTQAIRYALQRNRFEAMHFSAQLPCLQGQTRADDSMQEYGLAGQGTISTSSPVVKHAIDGLARAWPETLSRSDLIAEVRKHGLALPDQQLTTAVDDLLEQLIMRDLAKYRLAPVQLPRAGETPEIESRTRRFVALSGQDNEAGAFNVWHETVPLSLVERWLLPELDGTRDRAALVESLQAHVQAGRVVFTRDGQAVETSEIAACAAEHVDLMLARLPQLKLLKA